MAYLDVEKKTLSIVGQLVKVGKAGHLPLLGPTKNGKSRVVDLDERTIELLKAEQ